MSKHPLEPIKIEADDKFSKWADGKASCSGMTGSLKGILWFCGIEQGGNEKDYRQLLKSDDLQTQPQMFDSEFKKKYPEYLNWPLPRNIAKITIEYLRIKDEALYSSLNGNSPYEKAKDYHEKYLFNDDVTFLMNLYPMDFGRETHDFDDKDKDITNLPDKYIYQLWCRYNRLPHLAQRFIDSKEAKVLICSSSNSSRGDFLALFGTNIEDNLYYYKLSHGKGCKKHLILYCKIRGFNKHIFICPFFGQGGINDDISLQALGGIIASQL